MLAATARVAGDFDVAEECVQDAYIAALDAWTRDGIPRQARRLAHRHGETQGTGRAAPGAGVPVEDAPARGAGRGRDG